VVDRGTGAVIGGGVGVAAGLATVLFTRGRELVLNPGTQFDLELKKPLKFAYNELQFTSAQLNDAERLAQSRAGNPNPRGNNSGNRRIFPFPGIGIPRVPIY
jgi:hypothetical protein